MKSHVPFASVLVMAGILTTISLGALAQQNRSLKEDRAGIERLHKLDIAATLSGKADELAKLWDNDAVRLLSDAPVEIGKSLIHADDKREEAAGEGLGACYRPEIQDLQIAGDWAFEWGYFSYKASPQTKAFRGKVLRVIKRQPDGSWKFARVMAVVDEKPSTSPMSNACE
jgi:ketosteroid isomerase-like protein